MMYAMDWTFDMFMEDARMYKATPIKGVHCRANASDRERFMTWLKNIVRDYKQAFKERYNVSGMYSDIGDCFKRELSEMCFSDYYKDVYGQRPHLPAWFYIQAFGLPMLEDTARTFCATPVADAERRAQELRERVSNAFKYA